MVVLVVEDGVSLRRLLIEWLESHHHTAVEAWSLETARRAAADHALDAAIIDVLLPDGSGIDLIEPLLADAPDLTVVMTTAYPFTAGAVYALQLGATDYLPKPVAFDDLERALEGRPRKRGEVRREPMTLEQAEWEYINEVLVDCGGNVSEAARRLGVYRQTLQRKLRRGPPSS